ncbi:SapC family protein [Rugamonas apoptosis]|nr:SapC family protein [Rugamonas apoptosis]
MPSVHAVSYDRHAGQRWRLRAHFGFAAEDALVTLATDELPNLAMMLPVCLVRQEGGFVPAAMLGLRPGENLMVDNAGRWLGKFVPAAFKSYPFLLGTSADGQRLLCIDEDAGLADDDEAGEPFFVAPGQPSPALAGILEVLRGGEQSRAVTVAVCALLDQHGLIQPWHIALPSPTGTRHITDLFRIDEAALGRLPAEALAELSRAGALAVAYCQLLSVQHVATLRELAAARAEAVVRAQMARLADRSASPAVAAPMPVVATAPKVLLVTFDWSTLVEMPYVLRQAGCEVHVLCPSFNRTLTSGFYHHWINAGESLDTLLTQLAKLAASGTYHAIIIGDDPILWKIYRENIGALLHLLPVRRAEALPVLSKVGFSEYCRDHAIASPAFIRMDNADATSEVLLSLGLPIVLKENYSNGGAGVRILHDEAAFLQFVASHDFSEPLLAQRHIAGDVVGVDALFKDGELLELVCAYDIDATLGPASKRRYFANPPELEDIFIRLGRSALLHGFVNGTLIKEATTQRYFLLEADPRPTKWVVFGRWFGHDFAAAYQRFINAGVPCEVAVRPNVGELDSKLAEVEHFPTHFVRLMQAGRRDEALLHLLDYDRNLRYLVYDPVLLAANTQEISRQLTGWQAPECRDR